MMTNYVQTILVLDALAMLKLSTKIFKTKNFTANSRVCSNACKISVLLNGNILKKKFIILFYATRH